MDKVTSAQKKLLTYIKNREPDLSEKETLNILNNIKRFINLTTEIHTQPQARITYKKTVIDGEIVYLRVFNINLQELSKVQNTESQSSITEIMGRLNRTFTKK